MLQKEIMNTNLDGDEDIKVYIDASKYAVCIVVTQHGKIVSCSSKVLNPSQRRWATIERELYAGAWGLKTMKFYLHGIFFELFTDHKPLVGFFNKMEEAPNNRMMTMLLATSEYTFRINYLPGIKNILADFGTRYIHLTEWDKPQEDDQEGLHELFCFEDSLSTPLCKFITSTNLSKEDQQQIQSVDKQASETNNITLLSVKNQQKICVPIACRRPLVWYLHQSLHPGATELLQQLRDLHLYWPKMSTTVDQFLSQCLCTIKKNSSPKKYSEVKHIFASHPLHILAIDLYTYNGKHYLTTFCLYSRFCWVSGVANKQSSTVASAYYLFCQTYSEPDFISCDNGGEFESITTAKIPHPSEHPQANGVIERFHEELGKLCRIFSETPDVAYRRLLSNDSKLLLHAHLKSTTHDCFNCILNYETRIFRFNDLVWRKVPSRKRAKQENTYTGPHRILQRTGTFTYKLTSHLNSNRTLTVNLNDIKSLHIPDTKNWKLNPKYIPQLLADLGSTETTVTPLIDFTAIDALVLDIIERRPIKVKFFVIPDWPCAEWYKTLHDSIYAEAVKLPEEQDLFVHTHEGTNLSLGKFAWSHWLFERKTQG